jgi:hypothetical protein
MKIDADDEFQKFDSVVKKLLSVTYKELKERERKYKKNRARKKRTRT